MTRPKLLAALLPVGILLLAAFLAWPRTVTGVVRDASGPVAGATVRFRASEAVATTDADGRFAITGRGYAPHRVVTAWKAGYNPAGVDLSVPAPDAETADGILLNLKLHPTADDLTYEWLTSHKDPNVALGCGHCMTNYDEWRGDAHALSAQNPVFLSLYNGADVSGQRVGPGWATENPGAAGNCAACHIPAAELARPGQADPNHLQGIEGEGVFCDLCHKIAGVSLDADTRLPDPARPGITSYALHRPAPGTQIFYGTVDDTARRVSSLEMERKSAFCAPCHSGGWWGQSAYASYDEWLASPYAAEGVECQDCHMLPQEDTHRMTSACGPAKQRGALGELGCKLKSCWECHVTAAVAAAADEVPAAPKSTLTAVALIGDRPGGTLHDHRMAGSRDEAFLRSTVAMTVTAEQGSDGVRAEVAITNVAAGHQVPSDSTLRNMILVVEATDGSGAALAQVGGEVVPEWGGRGSGAQEYAGLPGKGFARILIDWDGNAPAPPWRNGVQVLSDNRIPARGTDRSTYAFALPADGKPARVTARLIYRRAFKAWADEKGWDLPDIAMAEASVKAVQMAEAVLPQPAPPPQIINSSPRTCTRCHPAAGTTWENSAHAAAATTPLFRAWYKAAGQDTNGAYSRECARCHIPAGLAGGQIKSRWSWAGREYGPLDESALAGVSCAHCHATAPAHTSAVDAPRGVELATCESCHEAASGKGVSLITTFREWRGSPFAAVGTAGYRTCVDCHFAGDAHGAVTTEQRGSAVQVSVLPQGPASTGKPYTVTVRLQNTGAGHAFPTGMAELKQAWLDVIVRDVEGAVIYTSGTTDAYGDPIRPAARFGVQWADRRGAPTDRQWEAVAPQWDHRIPAGGSLDERITFDVPPGVRGPLTLEARLWYRASSGYLGALMTTYLGEQVGSAAEVVAQGSALVTVK